MYFYIFSVWLLFRFVSVFFFYLWIFIGSILSDFFSSIVHFATSVRDSRVVVLVVVLYSRFFSTKSHVFYLCSFLRDFRTILSAKCTEPLRLVALGGLKEYKSMGQLGSFEPISSFASRQQEKTITKMKVPLIITYAILNEHLSY